MPATPQHMIVEGEGIIENPKEAVKKIDERSGGYITLEGLVRASSMVANRTASPQEVVEALTEGDSE